ncbi:MAG TPA: 4'-phosphopantetheinyl transferase superfamily protein [Candidatus Acidoferrales bacterium]|nr:4'-phosphopantetheinyl transferase superfamily protein [Candidatus Acidoferrales bacterium]
MTEPVAEPVPPSLPVESFPRQPSVSKTLWPVPTLPVAPLGKKDVHLWTACLDEFTRLLREFKSVLSPQESARASRFKYPRDRDRFVIAKGLLRFLFSLYRDVEPAQHEFTLGPQGKPESVAAQGLERLHFNVSHSDSMVLYAITRATAVGVDIERIRHMDDLDNLAQQFFTAGEAATLRALPAEKRLVAFFNCWTRKEAFLKATGQGIAGGMNTVEVTLAPDESARLLNLGGDTNAARGWILDPLVPAAGYLAALAYQGPRLKLGCWEVPVEILRRPLGWQARKVA